jgi:hemoglobin
MVRQHLGKASAKRSAHAGCSCCKSADDAELPDDPEFRAAFVSYLEWGSRIAKGSTPGAKPPPDAVPRWGG